MKYKLLEECFYSCNKTVRVLKESDDYDELEFAKQQYISLRKFNGEEDFFFYEIHGKK